MAGTTVYIDGACKNNGFDDAVASLGVYCKELGIEHSEKLEPEEPQTNGRAELKALIVAIDLVLVSEKVKDKVIFKSDSKYVVNAANKYVHKWRQNNWILMTEKTEAKHRDLWEKYIQLQEEFQFEVVHVKRDSEDGNKASDRLANEAVAVTSGKRTVKKTTKKQELDKATKRKEIEIDQNLCIICKEEAEAAIQCSVCEGWVHYQCSKLPCYQLTVLDRTTRAYTCEKCTEADEDVLEILESSQIEQIEKKPTEAQGELIEIAGKQKQQYETRLRDWKI